MQKSRGTSFGDWKKRFHDLLHNAEGAEEAKKALERLMQKGCKEEVLLGVLWNYTSRRSFSVTSLLERWGYPRKRLKGMANRIEKVAKEIRSLNDHPNLSPVISFRDRGLDAKFVFKDSFALDLALNPDFSQIESDAPQVTVNRRFEVFFPEKRPFFLENAGFFKTPINLFFTRRIADPQFGIRLTGKTGPYTVAALLADDESPGKIVPLDDPLSGQRARFAIVRINRDIFKQSTVGLIYIDREFAGSFNRVGGLDGRFKLSKNWIASFQGVASSTEEFDGTHLAGPGYDARLRRAGRQFNYALAYGDRSPGFRTLAGFVPRSDIRRVAQSVRYRFRPEGKYLISWGPELFSRAVWDHSGTRLDWRVGPEMSWEFTGRTFFGLSYNAARERLRPQDFEGLPENRDFSHNRKGFYFSNSYFPQLAFRGNYSLGARINIVPPDDQEPVLASLTSGDFGLIMPPCALKIATFWSDSPIALAAPTSSTTTSSAPSGTGSSTASSPCVRFSSTTPCWPTRS